MGSYWGFLFLNLSLTFAPFLCLTGIIAVPTIIWEQQAVRGILDAHASDLVSYAAKYYVLNCQVSADLPDDAPIRVFCEKTLPNINPLMYLVLAIVLALLSLVAVAAAVSFWYCLFYNASDRHEKFTNWAFPLFVLLWNIANLWYGIGQHSKVALLCNAKGPGGALCNRHLKYLATAHFVLAIIALVLWAWIAYMFRDEICDKVKKTHRSEKRKQGPYKRLVKFFSWYFFPETQAAFNIGLLVLFALGIALNATTKPDETVFPHIHKLWMVSMVLSSAVMVAYLIFIFVEYWCYINTAKMLEYGVKCASFVIALVWTIFFSWYAIEYLRNANALCGAGLPGVGCSSRQVAAVRMQFVVALAALLIFGSMAFLLLCAIILRGLRLLRDIIELSYDRHSARRVSKEMQESNRANPANR